ncbi:MAG TPA: RNA 2',3'-cyclic phosphodiesterase [Nitrososphaeraceae archaeon]|jgi:RNA 2',3'-cyclic 3'-phosphodiesterase|nr:RNA 2',3'-cyclic phosphodiesterase [Nitrososphaeraceae archaeon]
MRTFIAVDCNNREKISNLQQNILKSYPSFDFLLRPVNIENLHFTLFFFGEIENKQLELITNKMNEIVFEEFEINYRKIGAFPSFKYPKVIWIGLDNQSERKLNSLFDLVKFKMEQIGFRPDKQFKPHLTIFRIKRPIVNLEQYLNKYNNDVSIDFSEKIDKIHIKKSELFASGPVYSNILTIFAK